MFQCFLYLRFSLPYQEMNIVHQINVCVFLAVVKVALSASTFVNLYLSSFRDN